MLVARGGIEPPTFGVMNPSPLKLVKLNNS